LTINNNAKNIAQHKRSNQHQAFMESCRRGTRGGAYGFSPGGSSFGGSSSGGSSFRGSSFRGSSYGGSSSGTGTQRTEAQSSRVTSALRTLGLAESVVQLNAQKLRTAYRKKALETHPDKLCSTAEVCSTAEDAGSAFREVQSAYDTLRAIVVD
jgi:hypothetical protein